MPGKKSRKTERRQQQQGQEHEQKKSERPPEENASQGQSPAAGKVGSDPHAAQQSVGGKGDFGVPVRSGRTRERDYVSENTKRSDPGATQPRSSEEEGVRTHGAGGVVAGEGSSSGGDIDTDIIGVGTGGTGVAASGNVYTKPGPDDSTGSSDEFASGKHAQGEQQTGVHQRGGSKKIQGTTISSDLDKQTGPVGQGADAATNPMARGDDSFAGEVSAGEAARQGLPLPPSDTQGLPEEEGEDASSEGRT